MQHCDSGVSSAARNTEAKALPRSKSFGGEIPSKQGPDAGLFHATGTPFKGHNNNPMNALAPPLLQQQQLQQAQPTKPAADPQTPQKGPLTPSSNASKADTSRMAPLTAPRKPATTHNSVGGVPAPPLAQQQAPLRTAPNNTPAQASRPAASPARPHTASAPGRAPQQGGSSIAAPGIQQKPKKVEPTQQDEVGHYQVRKGNMIDYGAPFTKGRYHLLKQLGAGTYGKVVLCEDNKYKKAHVAVKLVRNTPHLYRLSAKNEIKILRDLDGKNCTVKLLRDFEHNGHVCMTFELLGENLAEVAQRGPISMSKIRDVAMQLLQAIAYTHSKKIIHSDVKTENVLLVSQSPSSMVIKLVDFGSALYNSAWHPPLVGTMHYRAPEAVLQAGWAYGVDLWAVGCILVELATGEQLFELAHDDVHLAMMERVLGPIPAELMRKGYANINQYNRGLLLRDARGMVRLAPCRPDGHKAVRKMKRLCEYITDPTLLDLCRRLFEYDPNKRISAQQALEHPFFDQVADEVLPEVPAIANAAANVVPKNEGIPETVREAKDSSDKQGTSQERTSTHQFEQWTNITLERSRSQSEAAAVKQPEQRRASMIVIESDVHQKPAPCQPLSAPTHISPHLRGAALAPPIAPPPMTASAEDLGIMYPTTAEDLLAQAASDRDYPSKVYGRDLMDSVSQQDWQSSSAGDVHSQRGSFSSRVADDEVRGDYPDAPTDWDWGKKVYEASVMHTCPSVSSMASTHLHNGGQADSPDGCSPDGSPSPVSNQGEMCDYPPSNSFKQQHHHTADHTKESVQNIIQAKVLSLSNNNSQNVANSLISPKQMSKVPPAFIMASPKIAAPQLLLAQSGTPHRAEAML